MCFVIGGLNLSCLTKLLFFCNLEILYRGPQSFAVPLSQLLKVFRCRNAFNEITSENAIAYLTVTEFYQDFFLRKHRCKQKKTGIAIFIEFLSKLCVPESNPTGKVLLYM